MCLKYYFRYRHFENQIFKKLKNGHDIKNYCNSNKYLFVSNMQWKKLLHTTALTNKIVSFNLSDIGEGIREVTVKEWFVKPGDQVSQFDEICEVQSDKASVTITSRFDGTITRLHKEIDETALVGQPLLELEVENGESNSQSKMSSDDEKTIEMNTQKTETISFPNDKILATPVVRRMAKESKVDLKTVKATGKDGRVLKEDLLSFVNFTQSTVQDVSNVNLSDRTEPIKGIRKAMVKSMTQSLKIPHFVYSDEIIMTKLVNLRNEIKDRALEKGYKLTYMPFFIKAASNALKEFPILNSVVDDIWENITYKAAHNVGLAMDTPSGLIVPNIKNVQNKNILEIAEDLTRLHEAGKKGVLKLEDLTGGTFSLSNIGVVGGTYTHPVISTPEVCIGAIGKIQLLPRFDSEMKVTAEHIINVSWAADHRIVDGVTMAKFSNLWKHYIENPSFLLLNLN